MRTSVLVKEPREDCAHAAARASGELHNVASIDAHAPFRQTAVTSTAAKPLPRHPISGWYAERLAQWIAEALRATVLRPWHVTLFGSVCGTAAMASLMGSPQSSAVAAAWVWIAWLCDRVDGRLARLQGNASRVGAWIDGNLDEFVDLGVHAAMAFAAATATESSLPWFLFAALVLGKYLLMHGLMLDREQGIPLSSTSGPRAPGQAFQRVSRWRAAYHLPGNADIRLHLLVAALLTGWLTLELALVAAYYNIRWLVRLVRMVRGAAGASR